MATTASSSSSSPSRKRPRLNSAAPPSSASPTLAEEPRLFRLWVEASRLAGVSAVRRAQDPTGREPEADRMARRAAHDAYQDALAALGLEERGLAYDPCSRRFVEHRPALDPRPSSRLCFQYYPVAQPQPDPLLPTAASAPQRAFELRVVNPETKRRAPPCTVSTLERHLPRRFRNARPRRIAVLRVSAADGEVAAQGMEGGEGVDVKVYDAADGGAFNRAFLQAVEGDGCDVIFVWRGGDEEKQRLELTPDMFFFPTYPALLQEGGGLLLLTPLHVYQMDGCESGARDVIQSLLDRASGVLGALVMEKGGAARLPYLRYDRQRHQREPGLAHTRAAAASGASSIEADGRALRITGQLRVHRYVPTFAHGWLSDDTAILLSTALRVFQPERVLELGAWLGLSSRFILREGQGSIRRFVTVDHFKNTAVGNSTRLEDVAPLDKLYFTHLRFETFFSNLEAHCFAADATEGSSAPAAPEVVMLRANVHEAPQLLHAAGEGCDLVFIDAEKNAGRLARLLQTVHRLYPQAVIVGDDLAFAGVKQALVDVGVPEERLVKRAEAYIILPLEGRSGGEGRDKAAVLAAMEAVAPRLAVPAWQKEIVALIGQGKDAEAVALGAAHTLGLGDVLYSPGKSILHDICRRRDAGALAFLTRYIEEELLGKALKAEVGNDDESSEPKALVAVNDVGLTPFDYLTDEINF